MDSVSARCCWAWRVSIRLAGALALLPAFQKMHAASRWWALVLALLGVQTLSFMLTGLGYGQQGVKHTRPAYVLPP